MAVEKVTERYTAGSKGIITEGNELASVKDSTLEESNYERLPDQTARRRRPLVQEINNQGNYRRLGSTPNANPGAFPPTQDGLYTASFIWRSPAQRDGRSILVEEINRQIRFYRIDHDVTESAVPAGKRYMNRLPYQDVLELDLWGQAFRTTVPQRSRRASTFSEGDGSLYIFNAQSGTLRVDWVGGELSLAEGSLQFTPVGTWVRDFVGAEQNDSPDFRSEGINPAAAGGDDFNGQPIANTTEGVFNITDELDNDVAYNLTNAGWPERDINEFKDQSNEDYRIYTQFAIRGAQRDADTGRYFFTKTRNNFEYPALQDRYLDGRVTNEDGQGIFTFAQLNEAQKRASEPPKGARVGSSDYHPAGSLSPTPVRHLPVFAAPDSNVISASIDPATGTMNLRVGFDVPQFHSNGREDANLAVFFHQLVFTLRFTDEDGNLVTRKAGLSGVLNGFKDVSAFGFGRQLEAFLPLADIGLAHVAAGLAAGQTAVVAENVPVDLAFIHRGPVNTPHRLPDNGEGYDHRRGKRPGAGAFFAGRLWQFGDEHDRIYYSQVVNSGGSRAASQAVARESLCFASAAPTDGDDSQVVATDGGYIYLPNSGTHFGGIVQGQSLFIFTDTGIYRVSPGGAGFFLPTDFQISKVLDAEVLGPKSWAFTGSAIHVATDTGILQLSDEGVTNLTTQSIRSLYKDLAAPGTDVEVMAAWDRETRSCRWVFSPRLRSFDAVGDPSVNPRAQLIGQKTVMLTYSERFDHWYRYDTGTQGIVSEILTLPYSVRIETGNRYRYLVTRPSTGSPAGAGAANDLTNVSAAWAVELTFNEQGTDSWVEGSPVGFTDFRPLPFIPDEQEPRCYMLTGHQVLGDGTMFTQIHYLVAHNREVTSHYLDPEADGLYVSNVRGSTLCSTQWDWSTEEGFGKFTSPQETHRYRRSFITGLTGAVIDNNRGESLLVAKIKVRGRGREFRILWEAGEGADSHIVGWNIIGLIQTAA